MADSIAVIEELIETQIAADPNVGTLDANPSEIAIFKVFRHAIAFVYNLFQQQQDDYEVKLQAIVDNNQIGTDPWWEEQMLAFQYGDLLVYMNNQFVYPVINPSNQVIQLCAVVGGGGIITLKCASLVGGVPQQLSISQLAAANSYAKQKRPCGLDPIVQSYPADLLKLYLNVTYNPQADPAATLILVEAAINNYINNLSTVNFNGIFYVDRCLLYTSPSPRDS